MWFGFPTFWVNRLGVEPEALVSADATGPDLGALERWLAGVSTPQPRRREAP